MKILYVCPDNSTRSQMAEGFTRKYAIEEVEIYSAGINPQPIHPNTTIVMSEKGIDISNHLSKSVKNLNFDKVDIYIALGREDESECTYPQIGANQIFIWPIRNPSKVTGDFKAQLLVFREVRDEIEKRVKVFLEKFNISKSPEHK